MLQPEEKKFLISQAVSMTEVYMKEVTASSKEGLGHDGVEKLEKFYDKLVELWKKDYKKLNE